MLLTGEWIKSLLPARPKDAHKGVFGRVLIIAGSECMSGAAVLSACAALKIGAGVVALALPKSSQCIAAAALPEMITLPLAERKGTVSKTALSKLQRFIKEFNPSVILIGPGLAKSGLIVPFLKKCTVPCVIDADALNALAREKTFPSLNMPHICTPHPAEMARLLGKPVSKNPKTRLQYAKALCQKTGGVSLLKGFETVLTDGKKAYLNPTGGPALAKAGSGDVLAGFIAGLWAQLGCAEGFNHKTALQAAACGVYLHGLCGDLASKKWTDRCVLASEVIAALPHAFREVLHTRT